MGTILTYPSRRYYIENQRTLAWNQAGVFSIIVGSFHIATRNTDFSKTQKFSWNVCLLKLLDLSHLVDREFYWSRLSKLHAPSSGVSENCDR
jgi:hypothetical protein